jgi:hypothetical protein
MAIGGEKGVKKGCSALTSSLRCLIFYKGISPAILIEAKGGRGEGGEEQKN